jgi:hypothetical protein
MQVQVDEARQHVHARGVYLPGGLAWFVGRAHVAGDVLGFHDGGDAVAFDHDVHRAPSGSAGAIDEGRVADHESFEGAFALGARRGGEGIGGFVLGGSDRRPAGEGKCEQDQ